jgi:iron complex transport system substrate-binding protein
VRTPRPVLAAALAAASVLLAACGSDSSGSEADAGSSESTTAAAEGTASYPITIEHALGTTTIEEKPERVATVNWANQEVPLALGVVPVGMAAANFGDDDDNGILPWVEEKLDELGGEQPVLFDETDGIDFEAVADTQPDVILAAYSGLTQEDYDTLSEIAPTVAYPEVAWGTPWREMIEVNSQAMGMEAEGDELVAELDQKIADGVAEHPELAGKKTMFLTHVDQSDLSEVSYYTTHDTRAMFFEDLGMATPQSVATASEENDQFSGTTSAEQVDTFDDVDLIVTYGDDSLTQTLEGDPLLSQMPAVANDAIVALPGDNPVGTAANPTPLSIDWVLDDYLDLLSEAALKTS